MRFIIGLVFLVWLVLISSLMPYPHVLYFLGGSSFGALLTGVGLCFMKLGEK